MRSRAPRKRAKETKTHDSDLSSVNSATLFEDRFESRVVEGVAGRVCVDVEGIDGALLSRHESSLDSEYSIAISWENFTSMTKIHSQQSWPNR